MHYKRLSQAETDGQEGRSPQVVIAASELHALRLTEAAGAMAEVNSGRWLRRRGFLLTVAIIIYHLEQLQQLFARERLAPPGLAEDGAGGMRRLNEEKIGGA